MIYSIIEIIATVFDVVFLIWYIPRFLHTRFYEKNNRWSMIVPTIFLAYQLLADKLLAGFDVLAILISVCLFLLYALLICNKKWFRAIIAGSSFVLITILVGSLCFPLFSLLSANSDSIMQGAETPARIVYLSVCRVIQFAFYKLILLLFKSDDSIDRRNAIFMLFNTIMTIIGLSALMTIAVFDNEQKITAPIIILLSVLFVSNFGLFFLIRQIMKMQRREYEYKLIQEKMNAERARAEDADAIWENIRRVRHDMRNHFTVIKGKLQEGDLKACEEYIDEIHPMIESVGNLVHTGNAIIDYLINTKFSRNKEIQIIVSGYAEIVNDIEDADLASLLGNILDNAFEAVEKIADPANKRIELYFLKQNQNRIILCKNSIEHSVLQSNKELHSTKKGKDHGLGHRIVAAVAEKHGGFVEYLESEGMFCVQIVLPAKSE